MVQVEKQEAASAERQLKAGPVTLNSDRQCNLSMLNIASMTGFSHFMELNLPTSMLNILNSYAAGKEAEGHFRRPVAGRTGHAD